MHGQAGLSVETPANYRQLRLADRAAIKNTSRTTAPETKYKAQGLGNVFHKLAKKRSGASPTRALERACTPDPAKFSETNPKKAGQRGKVANKVLLTGGLPDFTQSLPGASDSYQNTLPAANDGEVYSEPSAAL